LDFGLNLVKFWGGVTCDLNYFMGKLTAILKGEILKKLFL
jgi:hypothetical protein